VEEVMDAMRQHICALLRRDAQMQHPLSFVVIVPDWVTEGGLGQALRQSPPPSAAIASMWTNADGFTRKVVHIKEQAFLDGFQHTFRRAAFRTPNPTLCIVMQNDAGAAKWPVTDDATFSAPLLACWAKAASAVPAPKFGGAVRHQRRDDE
jgi:hypothetical protein